MVFCCQCLIVRHHDPSAEENTILSFTLDEIQTATKNFSQPLKTEEGASRSVYKGVIASLKYPHNDIPVVVKRVKMGQMGERQLEAEVRFLRHIKHQNLMKLIGYCNEDYENEGNWFLVYEYMPNGSLDDHLSSFPWAMRLRMAKDAATCLAYLHEEMIIFKDFKTSNILLDNQMQPKLSYFGYVREASPNVTTSVVGTKGYSAPERVQNKHVTTKMDIWSYGIFLQELITGGLPIVEENLESNPECMKWVCCYAGVGMAKLTVDPQLKGKYSEKSMQKIISTANKCLILEPKLRPQMIEVLNSVREAIQLEMSSSNFQNPDAA